MTYTHVSTLDDYTILYECGLEFNGLDTHDFKYFHLLTFFQVSEETP